jgi:uncharacterized Zn-binding protein involved in type VI secretion
LAAEKRLSPNKTSGSWRASMKVIRKGDALREYGGEVLTGHYLCFCKGIATKGDLVKCNKHGMTTIAQGSELSIIDGQPVALHGHRCACGCTLVSSFPDIEVGP